MEKGVVDQAKKNVLNQLISLMGDQMVERSIRDKKAPQKNPDAPTQEKKSLAAEDPSEDEDECPHCDGHGCRFCK
jgi:hypothetical protein